MSTAAAGAPAHKTLEQVALAPLVLHTGRCHCGGVRFTVRASAHVTAWDCNCSICSMKRNTHVVVPRAAFELLTADSGLATYTFGTHVAQHRFCRVCGICPFYTPRSNPDGVAVTVHSIEPGTLASVTVKAFDGQHWEEAYAASTIAAESVSKQQA